MATIRAVVALLFLVSCGTTRENTISNQSRVKNMAINNCNVPDRCGMTP